MKRSCRIAAVCKWTLVALVAVLLLPISAGMVEYADARGWMPPRLYNAVYAVTWEIAALVGLESDWDYYLEWWSSLAVTPKHYDVSDLVLPVTPPPPAEGESP